MRTLLQYVLAAFAISSCSVSDLGKEGPTQVSVNVANPTWDNGIGALINQKCVTCHTKIRDDFVPSNTPTGSLSVDTMNTEDFFAGGNAKSTGLAYSIYFKVFEDTAYPMPPNFATPLTTDEKAALKKYLENKGFGKTKICPTDVSSPGTYADVKSTIDSSCATAGCHAASSTTLYALNNLDHVKLYRSKSLGYLSSRYMPQGAESTFIDNAAGKALQKWLCAGADLK